MRLFIGFPIPSDITQNLVENCRPLHEAVGLRWTKPELLHVTLQFLGEVDEAQFIPIKTALEKIKMPGPLTFFCQGGGVFPSEKRPRSFWTKIQGDLERINQLAEKISEALSPLGLAREKRVFTPHVTLARSMEGKPRPSEGKQFSTLFRMYRSPDFQVKGFQLIQSRLAGQGPRYQALASYPLHA